MLSDAAVLIAQQISEVIFQAATRAETRPDRLILNSTPGAVEVCRNLGAIHANSLPGRGEAGQEPLFSAAGADPVDASDPLMTAPADAAFRPRHGKLHTSAGAAGAGPGTAVHRSVGRTRARRGRMVSFSDMGSAVLPTVRRSRLLDDTASKWQRSSTEHSRASVIAPSSANDIRSGFCPTSRYIWESDKVMPRSVSKGSRSEMLDGNEPGGLDIRCDGHLAHGTDSPLHGRTCLAAMTGGITVSY